MLRSPLLHFLLVGMLLVALRSTQTALPESQVVEVMRSQIDGRIADYERQMARKPSPPELAAIENQVIEDALWLEQARALELHMSDSVVRQRLILNMRFLEGQESATDAALFDKAISLGMDRTDTVVQRRMINRVQAMIRAGVRSRDVDEATLRSHYEATTTRWRRPSLTDLTHVYFSRDRRGEKTQNDARTLLARLTEDEVDPERAVALADPFLSGHRLHAGTPTRIVALFGPAFATGVEGQPSETWLGPIESAFGTHLVWIHERVESRILPFEEVRNRVLEDWISEESGRALREQIERRRMMVEVRILEDHTLEDQ